jgi:hypothetical protein
MHESFAKFDLRLAEEKIKRLFFGRFARDCCKKAGLPMEEFTFLGFPHICATDQKGKFALVRLPNEKSCQKFRASVRNWSAYELTGKSKIARHI